MKRDPITQFMNDPDNKARVFVWITKAMVITTFLITLGLIIFICYLVELF